MPSLFPSSSALSAVFGGSAKSNANSQETSAADVEKTTRSPYEARTELFKSWSVTEDAERKASELGNAAAKEYQKASHLAQEKAGKIELYSGKYCKLVSFLCVGLFGEWNADC